ncbi:MAG: trimeric intracellular cation channel family protein [Bacillota bacterium]
MFLLNIFIFMGIIASSISGALLGIKKQLDFFGIIVLGIATALGGGIIRDVLIGYIPTVAFRQPIYTVVATTAAVLVMLFPKKFSNRANAILFFDAVGLGVFTAVGSNMALEQEISSTFMAITIGVITGVGGGVLRDIFAQEIPLIFRKEVYAIASIAGASSLAYSRNFLGGMLPLYLCFMITFVIRLIALYLGIHQSDKEDNVAENSN